LRHKPDEEKHEDGEEIDFERRRQINSRVVKKLH